MSLLTKFKKMPEIATITKTKSTTKVVTGLVVIAAIGSIAILAYAAGVISIEEESAPPPAEIVETAAATAESSSATSTEPLFYVDSSVVDVNVGSATPDCINYNPDAFSCGDGFDKAYASVTDVSVTSFLPGDTILFRRGQTWREMLTIKKSGTQGNQITYGAFGTGNRPRITAADVVSGMAPSGTTNVYSASGVIVAPNVVLVDGTLGTKQLSIGALGTNNDWYFASGILYVYSTSDISGKTVEAGVRDKVVNTTSIGNSYYTLENLQLDSANHPAAGAGVYISGNGATGAVVDNCDIKYNLYGVLFFTTNAQAGGHTISNSLIHDNRISGIHLNAGNDGSTASNRTHIYNNQIYDNGGFGILAYSSFWLIERNTLTNNGEHTLPAGWSGIHIWGGAKGSPTAGAGDNNIVRYNVVSGTKSIGEDGSGISADMYADNNQIYQNVAYGNDGPGISLQSNDGNVIYNNTTYDNNQNTGGPLAITKLGEIRVTGQPSNNPYPTAQNFSIKNNIAYATAPYAYAIVVDRYSYNNNPDITNNIFYAPNAMAWFMWLFHNPSAGIVWNDLPGIGTDLNVDPRLTDPANLDFTLQSSSPAINAGINVGLTTDIIGTILPQGGGYDIGAYERVGSVDTSPPTVSISYTKISSNIYEINVDASDNVGVVSVQLQLDSLNLGPLLTDAPYTYTWNAAGVKGNHTLSATAVDAAGNTATDSINIKITGKK